SARDNPAMLASTFNARERTSSFVKSVCRGIRPQLQTSPAVLQCGQRTTFIKNCANNFSLTGTVDVSQPHEGQILCRMAWSSVPVSASGSRPGYVGSEASVAVPQRLQSYLPPGAIFSLS